MSFHCRCGGNWIAVVDCTSYFVVLVLLLPDEPGPSRATTSFLRFEGSAASIDAGYPPRISR